MYIGNFKKIEDVKRMMGEITNDKPISKKDFDIFRLEENAFYDSHCLDENGTFKNTKDFISYRNKNNKINKISYIFNDFKVNKTTDKVILKNPTDTIYNRINTINGKKFIY